MGRRRGSGSSIKEMVRQELESRQTAEAIQQAVAADINLNKVRYGTFAENGAIGGEYLPNGMSPNLLSARNAEYESWYGADLSDQASWVHPESDIWTERVNEASHLIASLSANIDRTYINIFLDRMNEPYMHVQDGQNFIFSTTVTQPLWGIDPPVTPQMGIRVRAATSTGGVGVETVYNTETVDMFTLSPENNYTQRVYAKFTVPAGKPYINIQVVGMSDTVNWPYIAINWNMLESVTDYRSFPSKYAAPTPRAGELSAGQMAFGLSRNLLPYGFSTLSNLYVPFQHDDNTSWATPYGIVYGKVWISSIGNGFSFGINANNAYKLPYTTLIPTSAPTTERLKVGSTYILSCDVQNNTEASITATLNALTTTSAANVNAGTGFVSQGTSVKTIPATPSDPVRMSIRFTVPSGHTYGPQIQLKGLRASGTSWGTHDELYMSNIMLEKLPSGSFQSAPSAYTPPIAGYRDISRYQVDTEFAGLLNNLTSRNISSGVDQTQPLSWVWRQKFKTSDLQANYLWLPEAGIWHVSVVMVTSTTTTDATRMRVFLAGDVGTDTRLATAAYQTTGAGSYNTGLQGSVVVRLDGATGFDVHVFNSSATARTIDSIQVYVYRISPYSTIGALA